MTVPKYRPTPQPAPEGDSHRRPDDDMPAMGVPPADSESPAHALQRLLIERLQPGMAVETGSATVSAMHTGVETVSRLAGPILFLAALIGIGVALF